MDLQLQGKTALVTGGSKGIGLACARLFAREGVRPLMVARDRDRLAAAADAIRRDFGVDARAIPADLSQPGSAEQVAAEAGAVDILVNNAGAIPGGTLEQVDEGKWRAAWELKVFGYINLSRQVLPGMKARRSGVIANVIGMAGVSPKFDYLCGGTANAALIAFTRGLGGESPRHGVRVFGINPSSTLTDRIILLLQQRAQTTLGDENRWQELAADLPFGRMATTDEMANLVVFGCSPLAGYLSGTVIDVDGGQLFAPAKK